MRLPDPQRSYAVLIGTSTYHFPQLADLPAVRNNLDALARILTDQTLGWLPAERCIVLSDPADVREVYRTLRRYAGLAEDTLLVYFAGHGRTGLRNELYLGLTDTDPDELRVSALPFDLIREVFGDSPAANRALILDCCFSGRAIEDMSGPDEAILGQIGIEGTYTLTSTPANAVALAPVGADYTAFTGELITLLRAGVPNGPELLTFATVYRQLLHTMTSLALPLPRQRGTGTVDQLALARNLAHHPGQIAALPSQRAGESSQAHADKAISHNTRSGASILDGVHIQGKKKQHVAFLGMNIFGLLSLSPLWISFVSSNKSTPIALLILEPLIFLGLFVTRVIAVVYLIIVLMSYDLQIDTRGIELMVGGRHFLYRWKEIERVVVRRGSKPGIYVHPLPSAPPLQRILIPLSVFPKLEKKTGWIFFARAQAFDIRKIETALAQFAGSRWDPNE